MKAGKIGKRLTNKPPKMSIYNKVVTDFISGVGFKEEKDTFYIVSFLNDASRKRYVFLIPKALFDMAWEDKEVVEEVQNIKLEKNYNPPPPEGMSV